MFIETVPNRTSPPAVLLRESYREVGQVKTRTLANLSRWPEHKVERLQRALKGAPAAADLAEAFEIARSLPHGHVAAVLGTAARKELRDRLLRRFGRNLTTYGPMLTGAAVASYLNRRATIALGQQIRKDVEKGAGRAAITQAPTQPPSRD